MNDYISRIDAIHAITQAFDELLSVADAVEILDKLPAADVVERKKGMWEDVVSDDNEFLIHACSVCGHGYHMPFDFKGNIYFHNFCPNCGADMRGDDDV